MEVHSTFCYEKRKILNKIFLVGNHSFFDDQSKSEKLNTYLKMPEKV